MKLFLSRQKKTCTHSRRTLSGVRYDGGGEGPEAGRGKGGLAKGAGGLPHWGGVRLAAHQGRESPLLRHAALHSTHQANINANTKHNLLLLNIFNEIFNNKINLRTEDR